VSAEHEQFPAKRRRGLAQRTRAWPAQVLCAAACGLAACWPSVSNASAPPEAVRLEVEANEATRSCLSGKALERSVERRLRREVFGEKAPYSLRVRFERRGESWSAALELSDAEGPLGTRELSTEARHCSALDDSLALVVALLVDTPPERDPEPEPPSAPAPQPARSPPPRRAPTPLEIPAESYAPREPLRFGVRGSALVAAGLVPGLGLGAELAFELELPRGPRVLASLEALLARERTSPGGGAKFAARRAGLELCGLGGTWGALSLEPCVGQRVGWMTAEGFDFDENLETTRLYYALVGGADARWELSGALQLSAGLRAEFPLTRDRFAERLPSGARDEVFRVAAVVGSGRIGLGARF